MRTGICAEKLAVILGALSLGVCLGSGGTAHGEEGVIEINSVRASAGGITGGDAPGFPVSINESGSYRLTSSLRTSTSLAIPANTNVIHIAADDVNLDLNGFTVSCRRTTIPPSGCGISTGQGVGIFLDGQNIRIEGGTIRDMAASGVIAAAGSSYVLEGIGSHGNREFGFDAHQGTHGQVLRSAFRDNGSSGLRFNSGGAALVLDTVTRGNSAGITVTVNSPVSPVGVGHSVLSDGISGQVIRALSCNIEGATRVCPP